MRSSTRSKERSLWKRIDQHFGSWPLNTISPSQVRAFVDELTTDLSSGYVRDIHSLVAMVFDYAVADELISQSPCVKVSLPKRIRRRVRAANPAEVLLLTEHIDPRYSALVSFLAATGCRIGEALAVKMSDLTELPRARVTIQRGISTDENGREVLVDRLKSDAGYRTITLPDWSRPILQRHIAERSLGLDSFLFPAPAGGWLPTRRFRLRFWQPACRSAALDVTPHELRHLHASQLIELGRPLPFLGLVPIPVGFEPPGRRRTALDQLG
jgi:integrase